MAMLKVTFSQMIVLWQTDQTQKLNFHLFFWRFLLLKTRNHLITFNFHAKNSKKQEEILKKISESWVFASFLFVRALRIIWKKVTFTYVPTKFFILPPFSVELVWVLAHKSWDIIVSHDEWSKLNAHYSSWTISDNQQSRFFSSPFPYYGRKIFIEVAAM